MNDKLFGFISLSRKAGKLIMGFDAVKEAVYSEKALVVIYASDLSARTASSMDKVIEVGSNPPYRLVTEFTMYDYSQICGKLVGVLAIADQGFADGIHKLTSKGEDKPV